MVGRRFLFVALHDPSFQDCLKLFGAISAYRTVCVMFLCHRQCCSAGVVAVIRHFVPAGVALNLRIDRQLQFRFLGGLAIGSLKLVDVRWPLVFPRSWPHKSGVGKLLDYFGDFQRQTITCEHCAWSGLGSTMSSGEAFGDGVDMDCPQCGERWGFVQYSVFVADDPPEDWEANIGRVAD